MSDLISRKDALDAIQKRADEIDSVYSAFWEGLKIAQDIVEKMPSAEPERNKGEWIWTDGVRCSRCYYKLQTTGIPRYCPNCGCYNGGDR